MRTDQTVQSAQTAQPSGVDLLADAHLGVMAQLSPIFATEAGVTGFDHLLDDFSPDAAGARADAARHTLAELRKLEPTNRNDKITAAVMRERLGLELERHDAGESLCDLNNLASPLQACRDVFDLMPTATAQDWEVVAKRMAAIPEALAGYQESLATGVRLGKVPAIRQVEIGIGQARDLSQPQGFFDQLALRGMGAVEAPLADQLNLAAVAARRAYRQLAKFLASHVAPAAPVADAVGRERYQLASRNFLGAAVDLDQTYEWGLEQLERIMGEQRSVVTELFGPGVDVREAYDRLNAAPELTLHGTAQLEDWLAKTCADSVTALDGVVADMPSPVRQLVGRIAPTQVGGIYYTGPSEDFSRPGTMWWSVPEGVQDFYLWQELTTVYHEGVPGHHLQIATVTYLKDLLNRYRRLGVWVSGHGEGWALYAEQLMDELGFLPTPAYRLGMLDGQRLRATRVALDIGVHLTKPFPEAWGASGTWDAAKAEMFLKANSAEGEGRLRFELDRYLGWPGQAPSYLVGLNLWNGLREQARERALRHGEAFDLRAYHNEVLALGAMGLDTLRDVTAGVFDAA